MLPSDFVPLTVWLCIQFFATCQLAAFQSLQWSNMSTCKINDFRYHFPFIKLVWSMSWHLLHSGGCDRSGSNLPWRMEKTPGGFSWGSSSPEMKQFPYFLGRFAARSSYQSIKEFDTAQMVKYQVASKDVTKCPRNNLAWYSQFWHHNIRKIIFHPSREGYEWIVIFHKHLQTTEPSCPVLPRNGPVLSGRRCSGGCGSENQRTPNLTTR